MTQTPQTSFCRRIDELVDAPIRIIVTDSTVIINFTHMGRLDLFGKLPGFEFVVPEHVAAEITVAAQLEALREACTQGWVKRESLTDLGELAAYAELRRTMGQGEAACLAMAEARGWLVASDDRRRFRKEAWARLGKARLVNTPGLMVLAIRSGALTIDEADQLKAILARHRFVMQFESFRRYVET